MEQVMDSAGKRRLVDTNYTGNVFYPFRVIGLSDSLYGRWKKDLWEAENLDTHTRVLMTEKQLKLHRTSHKAGNSDIDKMIESIRAALINMQADVNNKNSTIADMSCDLAEMRLENSKLRGAISAIHAAITAG